MDNLFLCDFYREDYEQYLRQAILFSSKVNVMYPDINYPRDVDKEEKAKRISVLEQYAGFKNVNIIPMKGETNRFVDFEKNPLLFETICNELSLTEVEKRCFLEYRDQEFDYLAFNGWAPWREFCSYMHEIFNIAIAYTDMTKLFCETYSNFQGNVLSNSRFLHSMLSSKMTQTERVKTFSEMSREEILNPNRRCFSGKHCDKCRNELKPFMESFSSISVKNKAIEILIPNYSELEVEDLYEIQLKASSEIEQLSAYINEISIVANNGEDLDSMLKRKINPSISELQSKVEGIRLTGLKKTLSIKDVATIPLLIQLLPDLPAYVPIALSAAFVALDAGIEIRKEYLELKQNPLYFTIKLKKLAKQQKGKKDRLIL